MKSNFNILVPLGGIGSRFSNSNYHLPKPLIPVLGKPIINWLFDSLIKYCNLDHCNFIIIPYHKELKCFNFESRLRKCYPKLKFKFYKLDNNTQGAADTILQCLTCIKLSSDTMSQPIICLDGDNFYTCDILSQWNGDNLINVFQDYSNSQIYSYIKISSGEVVDIIEKKKISDLASSGAYAFESINTLLKYSRLTIDNNLTQKGEYYISSIIKCMIKDKKVFNYNVISFKNYKCLGTPLQVKLFAANNLDLIDKKRYCFDLDGTLLTFPEKYNDYSTVKPINICIDYLKYLYNLGNTIIIYTDRLMNNNSVNINQNFGSAMANGGKLIFDTLLKYEIPYHEIYFGKPKADYYIDTRSIYNIKNLDKCLGFYNIDIQCRDFNRLDKTNIEIYRKHSDDLKSQIKYYLTIPNQFKNLFPTLINYDNNYKWYEINKINGLTLNNLLLDEELNEQHLNQLFNDLERIHNFIMESNMELDIYQNYCPKIKSRYQSYDYGKFDNHETIFNNLVSRLENYEQQKLGTIGMIHGDPVFTNILMTNDGLLKYIDMRGKIGQYDSIFGDTNYDWAKVYQSLNGYDEILENRYINIDYKNKLIDYFETYIKTKFNNQRLENIKLITKSLLFSLIPLHNNEKCQKYFDLISRIN